MAASPGGPEQRESISAGIAWMLVTMFCFVSLDTAAKYLMQRYGVVPVIWARFFFHTLVVALFIGIRVPYGLTSRRLSLQIWRSVLMLTTTSLFFLGLSTVPLASASTIMFLAPILVTVLAIPLLGEKVGLRRWTGVAIGFAGAMIVVRPGLAGFQAGMVLLLFAALSHAFYQVVTRQVRLYDSSSTSLFYTGVIGAILTSAIVPFYWQWPALEHWPLFLFLGIAGSVGHLCLIRAFQLAPASVVSPFSYTNLIWSVLFGFIVFGDLPDRWIVTGAALIIASGLYIFYRERKVKLDE